MSYPQYRKARRLTHECCNYCNGNCLLLDDGEECVCVQSISYSLLCRWFKVAVLPLDAAPVRRDHQRPGRDQTLRRLRGGVYTQLQPSQILPGLRGAGAPEERGGTPAEKIPPVYAFRAVKSTENKGFPWSAGRWIKLSCSPQNGVLNAGKWTKSAGRRGFDSLRARRFFSLLAALHR